MMKTMNLRVRGLAAAVIAVAATSLQEASAADKADWKLSLGYVYRSFGDIDFKSFDFNQPPGGFVDGSFDDTNNNGVPDTISWPGTTNPALGATPKLHKDVHFGGRDEEADTTGGFELRAMAQDENALLGWDLSLVGIDQSMHTGIRGITARQGAKPVFPVPPPEGVLIVTPNHDVGFVDYDIDLTLLTYGIGLTKDFECKNWYVRGGAGPTLSLVNHDTTRSEGIDYQTANGRVVVNQQRDDELDYKFGAYVRVGAGLLVRENVSVEVGARYDYIDEVDGDLVDLDLSGLSGNVSFVFHF